MAAIPWLKFFVTRWRACKPRLLFNRDERLLYLELLFGLHEYQGALPDDPQKLAMLAAFPQDVFDACWPRVREQFIAHPTEHGMLTNPVALEIINEQAEVYQAASEKGRNAARRRWNRNGDASGIPSGMQKREERREKLDLLRSSEDTISSPDGDASGSYSSDTAQENVPSSEEKGPDLVPGWFEQFWSAYWRKAAKAAAFKAFRRAVKTEEQFTKIIAAVEAQAPEMMRRAEQHRPHAASWLNGERWLDEPAPADSEGTPPVI